MLDAVLRAVPGVLAVFMVGLLVGARVGIGTLGSLLVGCFVVMVVAAVFRAVNEWHSSKKRATTSG